MKEVLRYHFMHSAVTVLELASYKIDTRTMRGSQQNWALPPSYVGGTAFLYLPWEATA